jgi:hypothetical protein
MFISIMIAYNEIVFTVVLEDYKLFTARVNLTSFRFFLLSASFAQILGTVVLETR